MTRLKNIIRLLAVIFLSGSALADEGNEKQAPVVIELFTSQSCASCVDAVTLFSELANRDDILALSWHVDYWNQLMSRKGKWRDPYSDKSNAVRQRLYNVNIRHRSSVYTPQTVINGAYETVGSDREKIDALIARARDARRDIPILASNNNGRLRFNMTLPAVGGEVYFVLFRPTVTTKVTSGENAGVTFTELNVVTDVQRLGRASGGRQSIHKRTPDEGGCALLIQEPNQGRIIAAAYCPRPDNTELISKAQKN